jgi:hypothetical protein
VKESEPSSNRAGAISDREKGAANTSKRNNHESDDDSMVH